MAKLDDIIDKVLNSSYEEKVYAGKESLNRLMNILSEYGYTFDDKKLLIKNLLRLFVKIDRQFTLEEAQIILDIVEDYMDYESFVALTNQEADKKFVKFMKKVINKFSDEERVYISTLGLVIITCDNQVDKNEINLLKKLCK